MNNTRIIALGLCFVFFCLHSTDITSQNVWTKTTLIDRYQVNCLVEINNAMYAGLAGGGIYVSDDVGVSWKEINKGLGHQYIYSIVGKGNKIYTSVHGEGVYISQDKGNTWIKFESNPDKYIYSLAISGPNLIAGTLSGLYYSKDDRNWIKSDIEGSRAHNAIFSLYDSKKGILAGSGAYILFSKDNGKKWNTYPSSSKFDIQTFTELKGELYAGTTGDGLLVSADGNNWMHKTSNKAEGELKSVSVIVSDSVRLIAGSHDKGVINDGEKMIDGKNDLSIKSFLIHKGNYFAGTNTDGVWTLAVKNKITEIESRSAFQMAIDVYPNPSTSSSNIQYSINQKANVVLEVIHPDGKLFKRLNLGTQDPGLFHIQLQDFKLSSGIYFLRLKANNQSQLKKLVILSE
ncbi:MAG: T9SS type A sorting domain-containing protein [Saprospiraceae bacterium]|nr:T9SS type A sorting domain-containing protein [Saprospiraceae bacterium]